MRQRAHPIAVRWYEALRRSGQARLYEPSDWATAQVLVVAVSAFCERPRANMLTAIVSGMASLAVTEGERRRLRIELEPPGQVADEDDVLTWFEEAKRRLRGEGSPAG